MCCGFLLEHTRKLLSFASYEATEHSTNSDVNLMKGGMFSMRLLKYCYTDKATNYFEMSVFLCKLPVICSQT